LKLFNQSRGSYTPLPIRPPLVERETSAVYTGGSCSTIFKVVLLTAADVLSGTVGGTNAETAVHIAAVPKTTAGRIVERGTVLQGLALRAPAPATARLGESPVGLLTWTVGQTSFGLLCFWSAAALQLSSASTAIGFVNERAASSISATFFGFTISRLLS
jgi:hypothetical protein